MHGWKVGSFPEQFYPFIAKCGWENWQEQVFRIYCGCVCLVAICGGSCTHEVASYLEKTEDVYCFCSHPLSWSLTHQRDKI